MHSVQKGRSTHLCLGLLPLDLSEGIAEMHHSPHSPAHSIVSTYTGLIYVFSGSKVRSDIAGGPLCQWKIKERRGLLGPRRSVIFRRLFRAQAG